MRILIDFTQIPVQKGGVGVYAYNLILAIGINDKSNIYYVLMQNDDNSLDDLQYPNIELLKVKSNWFRMFFLRCLLEQFYLPYLAVKYNIDIIHSLHYSFPIFGSSKKVVTIPDMTFYKFPEVHLLYKVFYFRLFIWLSSFMADALICISEATKNDYISQFKCSEKKLHTIYLGISDLYRQVSTSEQINATKNKYGITGEYLLFIGTIEPRKNIRTLLIAYERLVLNGYNFKLVIVGRKGWHDKDIFDYLETHNVDKNIILLGFIHEDDKKIILDGSKLFIYPSVYEGFGIPVLEAMACGIPTITSNVSSLPEVAGNAAILINPESVDELFSAMKYLLTDESIYNHLKSQSRIQAAKFNWSITSLQTIMLYESLS